MNNDHLHGLVFGASGVLMWIAMVVAWPVVLPAWLLWSAVRRRRGRQAKEPEPVPKETLDKFLHTPLDESAILPTYTRRPRTPKTSA